MEIKTLIFDWGDTIMRDLGLPGPMKDWDRVEWIPGAKEMLKSVSPEYMCCIATSAIHSNTGDMHTALKRVRAERYFHFFLSSSELGFSKPDHRFFSAILERLGNKPEECVSIGNLYLKDIEPAKNAGLFTVWYNQEKITGYFPKADQIINNWKDLQRVLYQMKSQTGNVVSE